MKILFISRAYPPTVGGIETQNFELNRWLSKLADVTLIANKRGKDFLPVFLPYAFLKTLFIFPKYDVLLLGDGVLGIVGYLVKIFYRKPVVCVIHALDLTYKMKIYQKFWVGLFIKKSDKIITVGKEAIRIGTSKGMPEKKFFFIPNGVDTEKYVGNYSKTDLQKIIKTETEGKFFILTSGRLAKRKGVAWFIENVMPKLDENICYVVAGDGADKKNIERAVAKTNLQKRVILLGYVTDEARNILFNTCDLFVQPNIKIEGDAEGFGISVIEAASCMIPVIASCLEGLQDAIKDGQNGFLVESGNAEAWTAKINEVLADDKFREEFGAKARQYVIDNYSWEKISKKYLEEIKKITDA